MTRSINEIIGEARYAYAAGMVDPMSLDGTKGMPSISDLAALPADDLKAMRLAAEERVAALVAQFETATQGVTADRRLPQTHITAIRRSMSWYKRLCQLTQAAMGARRRPGAVLHESRQGGDVAEAIAAATATGNRQLVAYVTQAARMSRVASDAERFVAVAKRTLTKDQYLAIWEEANRG